VAELPPGVVLEKTRGIVTLRGAFTVSEPSDEWMVVFTLPNGYRPDGTVVCGVDSQTGALELWIDPDGTVIADSPRRGWVRLEQISFAAAA